MTVRSVDAEEVVGSRVRLNKSGEKEEERFLHVIRGLCSYQQRHDSETSQ